MDKDKVLSLAQLARIDISDAEAEKLSGEFEAILGYVGEVNNVSGAEEQGNFDMEKFPIRNMLREDAHPHEGGLYTEKLLEQAPAREKDYVKVKKIL
jgi:aspartyl-tRNA(Asn)/glutamyl-tRNA(Gln) amidotransferase subunit C